MYIVEVKRKAEKEIAALPKKEQKRVIAAFEVLRQNPFVGKKLEGKYEGTWALRVWPYRILYTIHRGIVTVTVLRVADRKSMYR